MPGKHVIGLVADLKRENEGEYVCPCTTVFGLQPDEINWLVQNQAKMNLKDKLQDRNKTEDGIEITTSCWKLMRMFGSEMGFELLGDPQVGTEPGNGRTNLIWTMVKDAEDKE